MSNETTIWALVISCLFAVISFLTVQQTEKERKFKKVEKDSNKIKDNRQYEKQKNLLNDHLLTSLRREMVNEEQRGKLT